jgi:hypothetical protein
MEPVSKQVACHDSIAVRPAVQGCAGDFSMIAAADTNTDLARKSANDHCGPRRW